MLGAFSHPRAPFPARLVAPVGLIFRPFKRLELAAKRPTQLASQPPTKCDANPAPCGAAFFTGSGHALDHPVGLPHRVEAIPHRTTDQVIPWMILCKSHTLWEAIPHRIRSSPGRSCGNPNPMPCGRPFHKGSGHFLGDPCGNPIPCEERFSAGSESADFPEYSGGIPYLVTDDFSQDWIIISHRMGSLLPQDSVESDLHFDFHFSESQDPLGLPPQDAPGS